MMVFGMSLIFVIVARMFCGNHLKCLNSYFGADIMWKTEIVWVWGRTHETCTGTTGEPVQDDFLRDRGNLAILWR